MSEKLLKIKDLELSFKMYEGISYVLKQINLELSRGEKVALVGESGSGKSVTTKLILGLLNQKNVSKKGEIVFFDRSWYTRATVEITMGYCKHNQYRKFMNKVNGWERKLNKKGIELKKLYLSVSQSEQDKRFKARQNDPHKYWKLTKHDLSMAKKWDIYSFFKTKMFERTSTGLFPWVIINADNKMIARLSALRFILNEFNYPKKKLRVSSDWTSKINNYQFTFRGVGFEDLSYEQHSLLSKYLSE